MVQGAILGGFAGLQGDFVKFNVARRGVFPHKKRLPHGEAFGNVLCLTPKT